MTGRSVRTFFGRYMALLLIVALSAGFFAGLKLTKNAMQNTCDNYIAAQNMYDFRLLSTLGFTMEDVESFGEISGVELAEGMYSLDAMMLHNSNSRAYKLMSIPENVNLPSLVVGRMPAADNEILADDDQFTKDDIGSTVVLSTENKDSVTDMLANTEFTIVGLVNSPLYLNLDRGTTGIGSGELHGFLYLPAENFTGEVFTEVNITLTDSAPIYSDEYDELIEKYEDTITDHLKEQADKRYDDLVSQITVPPELEAYGVTLDQLIVESGLTEPETYVLTRDENAGYVGFESDTSIVSGIANIFPIFFIMIAMLVCITTMTRMVDEERTQIGVLKALGFSDGAIVAKYLLYAGSAAIIGWAVGFFLCTWGLPEIFWFAYSSLYDFAPMTYLFDPALAVITLAVSLVGILGAAYISCCKELVSVPAELIRPKSAKNGKRILLERIKPLWEKLPFLQKITLRNMFRYKQRLVMMLVGIGCCAGLVVTAFGVRDSMINIGSLQFDTVQLYDLEAVFEAGNEGTVVEKLGEMDEIDGYLTASVHHVDLYGAENMSSVSLMSFADEDALAGFWDFHNGDESLRFPGKGEAIVSPRIAEKLGLAVGDALEIRDSDRQVADITVSGIFDNYIGSYVVISDETYEDYFGEWEPNTALISVTGDTIKTAERLTEMDEITSVSQLSVSRENVDNALSCLDYIIWLVVLFSGALAFIVIFNLTNINLAERSREIATVQVLGFYPKETDSYVLRENLILSVIAAVLGMPLGTLFHYIVMRMIVIDALSFNIHITPISYVLAFLCTVLFAVIVNAFMKRQISKIHMAESLKSVE